MKRAASIAAGLFVLGFLLPYTHTSKTCVLCRALRVETRYAFIPWNSETPTECSRWYKANVEPTHSHRWERSSCRRSGTLIGVTVWGCSMPSPIWDLAPDVQMAIYQHMPDRAESKALFLQFADREFWNSRIDADDDPTKGRVMAQALREWYAASFPGSWTTWWEAALEKHREERGRLIAQKASEQETPPRRIP